MLITYEYECGSCGFRFERDQSISDNPVGKCPKCGKKPQRLISGGNGFIFKGGDNGPGRFSSADESGRLGRAGKTRVAAGGKSPRGKGRRSGTDAGKQI